MSRQDMRQDASKTTPGEQEPQAPRPMRVEVGVFILGPVFFLPIALIYGFVADWEPVGTTALLLLVGLYGIAGGYLWLLSRRLDPRPEDDPLGEIEDNAGEIGVFSPHSWWPLVLGIAVAMAFLGPAVDAWWLTGVGVVVAMIGLVGQLFEFSRGQHAH
jgi:hypothetical protein